MAATVGRLTGEHSQYKLLHRSVAASPDDVCPTPAARVLHACHKGQNALGHLQLKQGIYMPSLPSWLCPAGRAGVALSTLGPGATNFSTAVAYSQLGEPHPLAGRFEMPCIPVLHVMLQLLHVACGRKCTVSALKPADDELQTSCAKHKCGKKNTSVWESMHIAKPADSETRCFLCRCISSALHHRPEAHSEEQARGVPDCGCGLAAAPHHQVCKAGMPSNP